MVRGLYIAGTNMITAEKKIDVIGNNLANANTYGFKKDNLTIESFNDVLLSKKNGSNINIERPHDIIEVEENENRYQLNTEYGFFRIKTDNGISNNKDLKFSVDQEGYLSTYYLNSDRSINYNLGNRILDRSGNEIFVGEQEFEINNRGQVLINGNVTNELVKNVDQSTIGTINSGVKRRWQFTDHSSGQLQMTNKPLDLALVGDGYFEVEVGENTFYTRNGAFTINANQELMTMDGSYLQGREGRITLPSTDVQINEFGEIIYNNEIIDKITIVDFSNDGDLRKVGGTYFNTLDEIKGEVLPFEGEVAQGFLETSNVVAIDEMIKLTRVSNNYESSQKIITAIDQTLDKVINEVGVVRG